MNRTIAAIGIIALLAAAYVLIVEPLAEKRVEMQDRLQADYSTLIKYARYNKLKDHSGKRLEFSQQKLEKTESFILPSSDTSVAFAKLQRNVQGMATNSGLSVTSIKPLPTVEFKNYTGLPIFIDCNGNVKDFSNFLRRLDDPSILLDIDRLNISAQQDGGLRIKIQLTGLMKSS
jgi:Tfp pilus assembly protein PilO